MKVMKKIFSFFRLEREYISIALFVNFQNIKILKI